MTTVKHSSKSREHPDRLPVGPLYDLETQPVPRYELADGEMPPDAAYQIIHDELLLDGSASLNVATFVTTWMEPQAERLMAECLDKNMIDKDEYPQTAAVEARCVNILVQPLSHAPVEEQRATRRRLEQAVDARTMSASSAAGRGRAGEQEFPARQAEHHDPHETCRSATRSSQLCRGSRRCSSCRSRAAGTTSRGRGRRALQQEHDQRLHHAPLDLRRLDYPDR